MRDRSTLGSYLATTAACLAVLTVRNPSAFVLPQFYAEEGKYFFAEAYNEGWSSLFATANGYFHFLPRLIANLALSVRLPYSVIPAVFVYGCLPLYALLWGRIFTRLDLPLAARSAFCLATVLVPVGSEVFMSQTNIQWVLAAVPPILYLGRVPESRVQRVIDNVFLVLCFLTGPFSLFLVPLIAIHAYLTGGLREHRGLLTIGLMASVASGYSLLRFGTLSRIDAPPEAGLVGFAQLATKTFYMPFITLGVDLLPRVAVILMALLLPAALFVFIRAAFRSGHRMSLLFIACSVAAFVSTVVSYRRGPSLLSPYGFAIRTFYLPGLFLLWALIAATPWHRRLRVWWAVVFVVYLVQIPLYNDRTFWAESPPDLHWDRYAARLEAGEALTVPITPPGWEMTLRAKSRS